jgi:hypothetical protein
MGYLLISLYFMTGCRRQSNKLLNLQGQPSATGPKMKFSGGNHFERSEAAKSRDKGIGV